MVYEHQLLDQADFIIDIVNGDDYEMPRCKVCNQPIPKARIDAFVEFDRGIPDTCLEHSTEQRLIGFMAETGGKEGRKTGYSLVTLDPNHPNFKENFRRAMRVHKRAR